MSAESVEVLKSRLAAIRKAFHSGVLTVTHGDTTTSYRSLQAMERIISSLEQEIAGKEGRTRRKVRYLYQSDRGY
jgi:hypothetical protein